MSQDLEEKKLSSSVNSLMSDDDEFMFELPSEIVNFDEKKWTNKYLKSQFESLELHNLFKRYTDKIAFGYFSLFLILIFLLFGGHTGVLIYENYDNQEKLTAIAPDLTLYFVIITYAVITFCIIEKVHNSSKKWRIFCFVAFVLIFFANFFVPFYHQFNNTDTYSYTPAYTKLLVISCYVFFGIRRNWVASVLGLLVTIAHLITIIIITYDDNDIIVKRVFSDVIFLCCLNGLGLFFRYMNEIVQRRSFLDRRDCIVSTFQLNHEKEQEEQLMSSIIPPPLIERVKQNYLKNKEYFLQHKKIKNVNPFENSLLDEHENVTILFADIVHYTEMTTKLDIIQLLETLNELFGRFDDASEKLDVIRIKFLGDCYYCVSGLPPEPPPNPAEACVDLGLKMITIIEDVRNKKNLNINMRIGIHTGKIISGIIGAVKYQFDIWSKDVDIANKMESEGKAGKVHITKQTKDCLRKPYDIEIHPDFQLHGMNTYLVSPPKTMTRSMSFPQEDLSSPLSPLPPETPSDEEKPAPRLSLFRKNGAPPNLNQLKLPPGFRDGLESISESSESDSATQGGEGDSVRDLTIIEKSNNDQDLKRSHSTPSDLDLGRRITIYQRRVSQKYKPIDDRRTTADMKRRTAFMNNNIKRYNERADKVNEEMDKIINETSFSKRDQYTKIKEISSFLIFLDKKTELEYLKLRDPLFKYYILSQVALMCCVYLIQNLTLPRWQWFRYEILISEAVIVFLLVPCTWTYFIYLRFFSNFTETEPRNRLIRFLYKTSKFVTKNFLARLIIYTMVYGLFMFCVVTELSECEGNDFETDTCTLPWHMTNTCALALLMTFLFLKICIWIKLIYALNITIVYGYCVLNFLTSSYKTSETYNPHLSPQISALLSIVFLTLTLHLLDRQTDYMNRKMIRILGVLPSQHEPVSTIALTNPLYELLNPGLKIGLNFIRVTASRTQLSFVKKHNLLDHLWAGRLLEEKRKADEQQAVNTNMLINILPRHVAKLYLDVSREQNELYHERHNHAAIMFASIIFDENLQESLGEKLFLIKMNELITAIDTLINRKEFLKLEKIKIAKWTYMAVCGLNKNLEYNIENHPTSATLDILLNFAVNMYKKFQEINGVMFNFQLRIGICHGPIVAGVVGSKKPLYDIWGDAVNMASRMDTTGLPGKIQVMEKTKDIIEKLGYQCEFRGEVNVKGKGTVRTFFVKMNEDFDLVRTKSD